MMRREKNRKTTAKKYTIVGLALFLCLIIGWYHIHGSSKASTTSGNSVGTSSTIAKRQNIIKENLKNYLNTVTKDGTVSVSFYNLGATSGSTASKSEYADVYKEGSLETESNAYTKETAASTYKLFIIAFLMHEKKLGNFTWNSTNTNGFYTMIVESLNDYAESELETYGMSTIDSFIKSQGWYSPVFVDGKDASTTSHSLELLLRSLANGTGVFSNKSDREKILKLMGKQEYRTGIPTGVAEADKGTTVQDKVGFLDDTNNDAAIVTMPNGQRYILVIMTHGHNQSGFSGFPKIAKIAKNVQEIVYGTNAGTKLVDYSN
ncbi:serine hydrolase [Paucilactobacillus suebicus]|uniref:Beta-lactamase class A n=1 Tax=Paucilactobacillus suebicus DSM 5007 = KCTC 3549 TaxID=1423807 RepID=A0A0R1VZA0_9LACO|nr:serine hydrolase [Paucilactobacillus suebicus]KRM10977.1 Beta-lactamase class A [Paucilactobacillus suebicus DSM 5007 = KCTC 3549]